MNNNEINEHLKFNKNPNLIYKETIIKGYNFRGCKAIGNLGFNDIFDIYYIINEKNQNVLYLAIKSQDFNSNIDIIDINNNEIVHQLKNGHQNNKTISLIKCFKHFERKKDYLISSTNKETIVLDLNTFNIIHNIKSKYNQFSYSSILLFNENNNIYPNYIIISYSEKNTNIEDFINIYNFETGEYVKQLPDLNLVSCFYLLPWNKYNNNYSKKNYIIACCNNKIIIYDIYNNKEDKLIYAELKNEENKISEYYSACIYTMKNKSINHKDLLYASSDIGKIYIWDLTTELLFNVINTYSDTLFSIILYNESYLLTGDTYGELIVIDLNLNKIISKIQTNNFFGIISIKKKMHPQYKESILICGRNDSIKLLTCK